MDPNIVIKQEPIDPEEVEMVAESITLNSLVQVKSEKVTPPSSSKSSKSAKSTKKSLNKMHKKAKEKRKSQEVQSSVKEEKIKKIPKIEKDVCVEPSRTEIYPDHSTSDFYCAVCDSHMNSVQVWESHIQGKRHVKNLKKESGAAPIKKEKTDDPADLYYIDTRGAPSPSFSNTVCERRPPSPPESRRRKWYSPEPVSPPAVKSSHSATRNFDLNNMTTSDKMDYICKLTESIYPQSESDCAEIKSIISAFSQSILQFEIRQLPFAVQQKLAKELFRGK